MKSAAVCAALVMACGWFEARGGEAVTPETPARGAQKPAALSLSVSEKGIGIGAGNMGTFTLTYPTLKAEGDAKLKPVETRVEGGKAALRYANGGKIDVAAGDGKVTLTFAGMPASVKSFAVDMRIPFNYNQGGSWKIGETGAPFPAEKPAKPFLYQGHATDFALTSVDNKHLSLAVPPHSYQQLTDNREWNNNQTFTWSAFVPYDPSHKTDTIAVSMDASAAQRVVLVDKFGQTTRKDFPGKIKDEAELKADVAADEAYFAGFTPPTRDRFGGLPDSGAKLGLKKTGFFHVEQKGERWILVDPDGNAFFHLGICSFGPGEDHTFVEGRHDIYEWLPPRQGEFAAAWHPQPYWNPRAVSFYKANVIRKYGAPFDDAAQTIRMVDRVRKVGFNSIGAFSGRSQAAADKGFPRVSTLPLGQWDLGGGVPGLRGVFDPFEPEVLAKMDDLFAKALAPQADDPLLIGFFLANEQGFEDLPRAVPALPGKHACKRKLVDMLRAKYGNIAAFNQAWGADAASFEALADRGLPVKTKDAFEDMQAYTELFLDTYYRTIADTFHKYDKNHMLIGNRWQPGTANNETLCRVAGKYMDVISINYYTNGIDAAFIRRLYEWTGRKPQMWSEFYFTAEKESNVGGANDLPTQQLRGQAYRHYIEGAAALGFVVGVEWFTLNDQPVTGRYFEKENGERDNTGLFNVADRPYKPMLAEMAKANAGIYDVWLDGKPPYLLDHPRFAAKSAHAARTVSAGRALGPMKIDGQIEGWPARPPERIGGDRLASGRESGGLEAAFKVCWDAANLYLLANVTDATPMMNTKSGARLWNADGLELFIGSEKFDQAGTLLFTDRQILLGAGKSGQFHVVNAPSQPAIETAVVASVDGKGYTLEAAIPWIALGATPKAETELLFDLAVDNSDKGGDRDAGGDRTCQLMWNGMGRNSSDRGAWGRLKLVD